MRKIINNIMPFIECNQANKNLIIAEKKSWEVLMKREEEISEVRSFASMQEEDAEYLIESIRKNLTSLQEKAKVTVVAVTLAFAMIGSISSYLINLDSKFYVNNFYTTFLLIILLLSIFYLISAGFFSLLTLNSRKKYDFGIEDFVYLRSLKFSSEKKKQKLIMIGEQYKMSSFINTRLNNYVDCSNSNLRNALISLGIFFALICLSIPLAAHNQKEIKTIEEIKVIEEIQYELQIIKKEIENIKEAEKNNEQNYNQQPQKLKTLEN